MQSEAPSDDILELVAEVEGLRWVVQRLAGALSWDRASAAATAVAKSVVEARLSGIAKQSAMTESVFAESSVEAGSTG